MLMAGQLAAAGDRAAALRRSAHRRAPAHAPGVAPSAQTRDLRGRPAPRRGAARRRALMSCRRHSPPARTGRSPSAAPRSSAGRTKSSPAWTRRHRRLALVAGEPGNGKTRLAAQFARRAHESRRAPSFMRPRATEDTLIPYQPSSRRCARTPRSTVPAAASAPAARAPWSRPGAGRPRRAQPDRRPRRRASSRRLGRGATCRARHRRPSADRRRGAGPPAPDRRLATAHDRAPVLLRRPAATPATSAEMTICSARARGHPRARPSTSGAGWSRRRRKCARWPLPGQTRRPTSSGRPALCALPAEPSPRSRGTCCAYGSAAGVPQGWWAR